MTEDRGDYDLRLWDKSPAQMLDILNTRMGGGRDAYGDWGLHVVAILQAKVSEQAAKQARRLVYATWGLALVTMGLAVVTAWQGLG